MRTIVPVKRYGFVHAGDALDRQAEVSIYLDGLDVTARCHYADDLLGFVVLYTTKDRERQHRELHQGDVRIFACEKE